MSDSNVVPLRPEAEDDYQDNRPVLTREQIEAALAVVEKLPSEDQYGQLSHQLVPECDDPAFYERVSSAEIALRDIRSALLHMPKNFQAWNEQADRLQRETRATAAAKAAKTRKANKAAAERRQAKLGMLAAAAVAESPNDSLAAFALFEDRASDNGCHYTAENRRIFETAWNLAHGEED